MYSYSNCSIRGKYLGSYFSPSPSGSWGEAEGWKACRLKAPVPQVGSLPCMAARRPPLLRVCTRPLRDFSGLLTLWPLWLLLSPDLLAPLGWGRCLSTLGTPSSPSAHLVRQHLLKINTLYQRKHWFHHLCRVDHGQEGQWVASSWLQMLDCTLWGWAGGSTSEN